MSTASGPIKISTTFRNTEATEALKSYANDKLSKCLGKFIHQETDAHVILKVEKHRQIAEIAFNLNGREVSGKEESEDLYKAIDLLVNSLTQQLRKHKEKLTQHH